jgi:hypothetical protein
VTPLFARRDAFTAPRQGRASRGLIFERLESAGGARASRQLGYATAYPRLGERRDRTQVMELADSPNFSQMFPIVYPLRV